ncbi:EF-hand domain-containing protein, partial [archaeon]
MVCLIAPDSLMPWGSSAMRLQLVSALFSIIVSYLHLTFVLSSATAPRPRRSAVVDDDDVTRTPRRREPSPGIGAVLSTIREQVEEYLGSGAQSAKKVKATFTEIDRNGNGKISAREFTEAMKVLEIKLNEEQLAQLFNRFDRDRSGELDYKEFLDLLGLAPRGSASSARIPPKLKEDTDAIL